MQVAIFGAGLMGSGIAAISALAGNRTILIDLDDVRAEKGQKSAFAAIDALVGYELATSEQGELAKNLIVPCSDMAAGVAGASLIIEAIFENVQIKQQLFKQLDAIVPEDVPICSNTSGLRITDIAALVEHPERTMTTHFWFPAHLVPLVEVVMWEKTDPDKAVWVRDELKTWGKAPVIVKRDLPGQLANRILQAVIREAINIVAIDLASPEDVDTAVKMGMGIRFPAWGPLEHVDAVGMDLCESVQNTVLPGINSSDKANPYMTELVKQGNLGVKTGKGFYDWSIKSMSELAKGRDDFIVHALKQLRK
ncbi:MAG: 3-hydroxyacyl-CoA dehydrogenase family protein [Firmicutes bacterium]|nr:3-hydroxyacyl-CoA dehydrogenase family protein [Bacillota bacterium]